MNGALLTLASFGLIIPAIYRNSKFAEAEPSREVSLEISAILFLVYLASLIFTLVTSKPLVGPAGVQAEKDEASAGRWRPIDSEEKVGWGRGKAIGILVGVTIRFARKDKMDLAIGITVGASTQVALLVAPILVFAGFLMGQRDMNLLVSPYEMWAIIMAVYVARNLIYDGSSNWLEGLVLIALYFMLGIGFFYLPA
jgi:Ca2+:H+ antiporter